MTSINEVTSDLTDDRLCEIAVESHSTHMPLPKLREIIALGRLAKQLGEERGLGITEAAVAARDELGIKPVPPEQAAKYIADQQSAPPATNIRPSDLGADGRCDYDDGCAQRVTKVVLSANAPTLWAGAPAACLAFLCDAHVDNEPIARREHAEHNAQSITDPAAGELRRQLIDHYPTPITLI